MQHRQNNVIDKFRKTAGTTGGLISAICSLIAVLIIPADIAEAHEAWLQPLEYRVAPGSPIKLDVMAGQNFSGHSLSFNPVRFSRMQQDNGSGAQDVQGRLGDLPAVQFDPPKEGLYSVVYQSRGSEIKYDTAEKFRLFAEKEGVEWILKTHQERNLPQSGFSEQFFRYCKSLVGVGHSDGNDRYIGMPFELVALQNPLTGHPATLTLKLLWNGQAETGLLSVYEKTSGKQVELRTHPISESGEVTIHLQRDSEYLLNVVKMESLEPEEPDQPVWQSHWASLTFATPA